MRRGSALLGQLLESFGRHQKLCKSQLSGLRASWGPPPSPEQRCLVPPSWAKGLGAVTAALQLRDCVWGGSLSWSKRGLPAGAG